MTDKKPPRPSDRERETPRRDRESEPQPLIESDAPEREPDIIVKDRDGTRPPTKADD